MLSDTHFRRTHPHFSYIRPAQMQYTRMWGEIHQHIGTFNIIQVGKWKDTEKKCKIHQHRQSLVIHNKYVG